MDLWHPSNKAAAEILLYGKHKYFRADYAKSDGKTHLLEKLVELEEEP